MPNWQWGSRKKVSEMKYRPDFITNSSSYSTVIVTNEQFHKMVDSEVDSLVKELKHRYSKIDEWLRPNHKTLKDFVLYLLGRTCIEDDSLRPQAAAYIDGNHIRHLCGTDSGGMYYWTYYSINHQKTFNNLQRWGILEVIDEGQFQDDNEGFEDEYMIAGETSETGKDIRDRWSNHYYPACSTCVHRLSKLVTGTCNKCRKLRLGTTGPSQKEE
jgi:hypothetical protein